MKKSRIALIIAMVLFFIGTFMIFRALYDPSLDGQQISSSELLLKEKTNKALEEGLNGITLEKEIMFVGRQGEVRISNRSENPYLIKLKLIRDRDNKNIYETKIIDPGYYIEKIELEEVLEDGTYLGTAIFEFYTKDEVYVGEAGKKIVMIVKN